MVDSASGDIEVVTGGDKVEPGPNEELMPTAHKEREYVCKFPVGDDAECGKTTTAKTYTAVCIGCDLAVAMVMPDKSIAVYRDGLDADGEPMLVPGKVVKIGSDDVVYSFDGKQFLTTDNKWEDNPTGRVPGEHSPFEMKEVR